MSKEMMIIFVYDMEYCKNEEDDPASAILYFYPNWVSDQQKTNLCGQIMGTTHFLRSVFNCPKILALQCGKFCIKEFGRFILVVGTDRNIDDWVLQRRADMLTSFIHFFHCDLEIVSQQFQNQINFSEKLYNMFDTYLRVLQYSGNIFSNVPVLQLPKGASSSFLEGIHILQNCQEMQCVLGGLLLFHNKVLATQLSSNITKQIVMTDPYRIKSSAEVVQTDYCLPLGVQLLQVYITKSEFKNLYSEVNFLRSVCHGFTPKSQKKTHSTKSSTSKEPILSSMKRDQSLIFTTVPEEDVDHISPGGTANVESMPQSVFKSVDRPKSLNLKRSFSDNKISSKLSDVPQAGTPYTGQTSVCSTPMTEKFLHDNPLLVCRDIKDAEEIIFTEEKSGQPKDAIEKSSNNSSVENSQKADETASGSVNSVLSALNSDTNVDIPKKYNKEFWLDGKLPIANMIAPLNISDKKYSASSAEIHVLKTNNVMMRSYGFGLSSLKSIESEENVSKNKHKNIVFNTITDPMYPVFRADGLTISKPLYDSYMQKHCEILCLDYENSKRSENQQANVDSSVTNTDDWKSIDDFDCDNSHKFPDNTANVSDKVSVKTPGKDRRSLSLPLKPLNSEQNNEISTSSFGKKNLSGVQLTPLMAKLSILTNEDQSSGFCSRDNTPCEFKDLVMTPSDKSYSFLRKNSTNTGKESSEDTNKLSDDEEYQKVILCICGQQDMVLGLLLEEESVNSQELIRKIWEVCVDTLGKLEAGLRHFLDLQPVGSMEQSETYSYLCVDPKWDTSKRGGPWGAMELGALTHLHRDFKENDKLSEITLRNEDSVIYGYRFADTEIYYQQSSTCNAGLPPPADLMGTVPLKARRKLERDHSIIIL